MLAWAAILSLLVIVAVARVVRDGFDGRLWYGNHQVRIWTDASASEQAGARREPIRRWKYIDFWSRRSDGTWECSRQRFVDVADH